MSTSGNPFKDIVESDVWGEAPATKLVYLTLVLRADRKGYAETGGPNSLARAANVDEEAAAVGIRELQKKGWIRSVPGGWQIVTI